MRPKKKRLTPLDGLRGFAAFSVFMGHSGFSAATFTNIPLLINLVGTLSVGTSAVQILFVLSGFLMAFLYSDIKNVFSFLRKRYTRIFPLYIVIIIYLWLGFLGIGKLWYEQLTLLIIISLFFNTAWRNIRKFDKNNRTRTIIFFGFIFSQILTICLSFLAKSNFLQFGPISFSQALTGLSNVTLTSDFIPTVLRLSNQAWSLVPELIFYILFPFVAVPLIKIAKKGGLLISVLLTIGMTKIFFDLDTAFYSFMGFQSMNIARSSGFVAGVFMGSIYKSQGKPWKLLSKIFNYSISGVLIFISFLIIQWGVGNAIKTGNGSFANLNVYYLVSSWIIALLIASVMHPKTIMSKIFSNKFIAFFGLISYSVYLIHTSMLTISDSLTNFIKPYIISPQLVDISRFFIALGLTILVSYFLFKFIESVYFVDKNHKNENSSVQPRQTQNIKKSLSTRNTILGGIVFMLLLFFLYSGNYASSLFVARSTFANSNVKNNTEVLLSDRPTSIFFTSKYSNLSVIVILFRYTNDTGTIDLIKQPRQLVFRLYSQDKKQLIFKSQRDAYQVNGQLRFPFGFTTQIDSKNKKYIAEISIEGVRNEENIYINTSSTSFVTAYTNPRENKIQRIPSFLINRFIFVITNSDAQFALGFLTLVVCLQLYQKNFKNLIVSDSISKSATFRYN